MMRRKFFLYLTFLLLSSALFAQSFARKTSVVTVGYGAPNLVTLTFRIIYNVADHSNYSFSAMGPVVFRYEYGVADKLGISVVGGYSRAKVGYNFQDWNASHTQKIPYTASITWQSPSVGVRANFHFANGDRIDPYIGAGIGLTNNTFTYSDNSPYPDSFSAPGLGSFYFSGGLGLRYYFTENIGFYAELGWDKFALAQAGLALKF